MQLICSLVQHKFEFEHAFEWNLRGPGAYDVNVQYTTAHTLDLRRAYDIAERETSAVQILDVMLSQYVRCPLEM